MKFHRLFLSDNYKGEKEYLVTQRKYEIGRTVLYFTISISLFLAGYITTKERLNLLSVVAALGCLPACKSLIDVIMFCKFKGCSNKASIEIESHSDTLHCLYDMVFTSYKLNFNIAHMVVCGNTVCGYSESVEFAENEFYKHIGDILKLDGHKNVTVKIFTDLNKYTNRLDNIKELECDEQLTNSILNTLKSVAL